MAIKYDLPEQTQPGAHEQSDRICLHCLRRLPRAAFTRFKGGRDGLRPECNECRKLRRFELDEGGGRVPRFAMLGARADR